MELRGYLTDGKTAERREVRVIVTPSRLQIVDSRGEPVDAWPHEGLALAEEVYSSQPVRLRHRERGDARLTLGPDALPVLRRHWPQLGRRDHSHGATLRRIAVWGLALGVVVTGLVLGVPRAAGPVARMLPDEWTTALGDYVVDEQAAAYGVCSAGPGRAALDGMVERLRGDVPVDFRVEVLDAEPINAFAAPGGRIVLYQGLMEFAESPAEVAGVLAHEMAHAERRHPTEGLVRAAGYRLLAGALVGDAPGTAAAAADAGRLLLELSYSRDDEAHADRVAVRLLERAGMRSDGLVRFFERMREARGDVPQALGFLSTHPRHGERIERLEARVDDEGRVLNAAQWRDLRAICAVEGSPGRPAVDK